MRAELKQSVYTGWALGIILGISLLVHVASLILGSTLLAGWHCVHHPVHAAIEMAGAVIAFVVAHMLITLHRRGEGTSFNVVIAAALVGMGVLDGLHALVHAGNTFVFLHSLASFAGGLLFALVWLPSRWTSRHMNWWPWAVLAIVSAVGVISMAQPSWAPVMVRGGEFTLAAKCLNVAGGLLMFAAVVRLMLKYRATRKVDDVLFCLHCGLFGAAAVMFEQSTLWDFAWWGWHVLRLMAYGVALWFMILSDERTVQKVLNDVRRKKERQQQLMRAAINTANEAMFTVDSRGRFIEVNQTACDRLEYSHEELLSMNTWDVNTRLSQSQWDSLWHDVREKGRLVFETEHRTKSGRVFPVEISKVLVDFEGAKYICDFVRDITDRKEATRVVQESEARFQQLASHLDDILWMTSADGAEIIYVSPAYESVWGRSCESLYQRPADWTDGLHPADRDRVAKAFYEGAAQGDYDETFRVVRPDGSQRWVHATGIPIRNASGEVYRVAGIVRDVTARKRTESHLEAANTQLQEKTSFQRAVLNSAEHSIIATDLDGRITAFNRGAERLLGYAADELIHKSTPEVIHDKDEVVAYARTLSEELGYPVNPGFETFVAKARLGEADEREWTYIRKDGSRVPVLLSVTAIRNDDDSITGYLGVALDITESKESELQLRKAKMQAEEASLAKSQFLASMSHELRTPLNGVIGMTELLAGTELDPKQRQFVDACRNSGEALLQLINDILDLSKIEAGKLELDLHDFDLEKLVTDTVDTMAWRAVDKSLEMPCYVDQKSRMILRGDSNRLRQVLVNLIGNAIKFTETGEIVVRAKTVRREADRLTVRFSVSDTGIGIPADKLDRLFQSFSQVDSSTTRNYGGTGLGLAISQSLVELMGGAIGVDSEAGKGSTFWFEVPFALAAQSNEDLPGQMQLAGLRALIVDDNETNRIILAEYASGWGLTTITTASVDEALAAVDRAQADGCQFHVVLTDYNMPERNGLDLSRALKQHPELVVLVLGSTDICLNPDEMREHGVDAVLRKPLRRHELYDVLCGVLVRANAVTQLHGSAPHAANEAAVLSGHILLAEDNSINRMYMVELMKQLGCTCEAVTNGREAIDAVRQRKYDLVLMDCQMPEVDGFDATRHIRKMEADGTLDGHLPIIALTANAVRGDRERCLVAGMDEYLSKPVQKEQVASMFARFLGSAEDQATAAATVTNDEQNKSPETAPIDAASLLARCFGNLEFAGSLLDELEATGVQRVDEIRQSAAQHNAAATADAAHALKGAAGILCAETVQKLAAEIEQAGRASDIESVKAELDDLVAEMERCLNYVPQLRQELNLVKEGA